MTDPHVVITEMTSDHVADVMQLWQSIDGVVMTDTDNPEDLSQYFERNPGISQVAIAEGKVIGAVLCGHDGRRGYLHHLAVAEEYRGRGVGQSLVDACTAGLTAVGIKACNLFVVEENKHARRFWRRRGWKRWAEIRVMSTPLVVRDAES